eukprot:SAG22_NODE_11_length_35583_cov_107.128790_10_plen_69_part_00
MPLNATDFEPSNKGRWYPSDGQKRKAAELRGPRPGTGDDPLWCRYCAKRFGAPRPALPRSTAVACATL